MRLFTGCTSYRYIIFYTAIQIAKSTKNIYKEINIKTIQITNAKFLRGIIRAFKTPFIYAPMSYVRSLFQIFINASFIRQQILKIRECVPVHKIHRKARKVWQATSKGSTTVLSFTLCTLQKAAPRWIFLISVMTTRVVPRRAFSIGLFDCFCASCHEKCKSNYGAKDAGAVLVGHFTKLGARSATTGQQ